jgi:predicted PurR-regulated permease PerM
MDKITPSRLLMAAAIFVGAYFLAQGAVRLANLWILIFGSVVVAVVLRAIADPLVNRLHLKDGLAVLLAIAAVLLVLGGVGFLFGQQISQQLDQLSARLPAAWEHLQARWAASPAAGRIVEVLRSAGSQASHALALAPRLALSAFAGVTTIVLVLVAGVFLAIRPREAREGVLSLAPQNIRPRLRQVMDACGRALNGWLKAQLVSMILVGSLVGLGLWVIGVPAPLALGLFAGLAQFVPIVGPIASAVPALIIAATGGSQAFLLTLALFVAVSQLEANLITPLVQRNVASLPVVLGIFAVVGLGTLFGPLGVVFATPLSLVLYTIVTMLYRHDILHDPAAKAPGADVKLKSGDT